MELLGCEFDRWTDVWAFSLNPRGWRIGLKTCAGWTHTSSYDWIPRGFNSVRGQYRTIYVEILDIEYCDYMALRSDLGPTSSPGDLRLHSFRTREISYLSGLADLADVCVRSAGRSSFGLPLGADPLASRLPLPLAFWTVAVLRLSWGVSCR